jgi:putative transposase
VGRVSRSTVVNILRHNGLDPGPQRGEGTWDEFIKRHASTLLWACGFFSKKVWTTRRIIDIFVLVFLPIGSRRVHVADRTAHPDGRSIAQQARNISLFMVEQPDQPRFLLCDRDTQFTRTFVTILESYGIEVQPVGPRAPNLHAHCERWVQSIQQECLVPFIVFGESHLRHIVSEYVASYNTQHPHQSKDNQPAAIRFQPC